MDFNQLVITKIAPLFKERGFQFIQLLKDSFEFKSAYVEGTISYNELDQTCFFEIGKKGEFLYPINDESIKQVFSSNIKIDLQAKEGWVNNIGIFLREDGSALLREDLNKINDLKSFIERESEVYTSRILEQQNLAIASKIWEIENYSEFIRLLDQINKDTLPLSYQLKYKLAKQRLKLE